LHSLPSISRTTIGTSREFDRVLPNLIDGIGSINIIENKEISLNFEGKYNQFLYKKSDKKIDFSGTDQNFQTSNQASNLQNFTPKVNIAGNSFEPNIQTQYDQDVNSINNFQVNQPIDLKAEDSQSINNDKLNQNYYQPIHSKIDNSSKPVEPDFRQIKPAIIDINLA